jgi:molybdenum cofactor cytidylyltransferase
MIRPELAAVVLAAGFSSRMGAFKPLLPFGSSSILQQILATVREAGVGTLRVVVGWNAHLVIPLLDRDGVPWVMNERYSEGMYASVQAGVRNLPAEVAAFFLMPGDMPLVQGATLARLIAAWDEHPGGILYPCCEDRRGHPPIIAGAYISEILRDTPPGGLRTLLGRHASEAREIPCDDPGILQDLDTPDDYNKARTAQNPIACPSFRGSEPPT